MKNCVCRAAGIASVFLGKLEQYIWGVKYCNLIRQKKIIIFEMKVALAS